MNLKAYKAHFDTHLELRLENKLTQVKPLFPDEKTFSMITYLKPYVDHGKRFRPYMVYLWYSIYGADDLEFITRVGLVNELIHIFALIHDDICDQGTSRHGIASYHKQLATMYENPYHGDVQAMLVGDLVYTRAMQEAQILLCEYPKAHQILFTMLNEVVIGQMLDVHFSTSADTLRTKEEISDKDHLKSGQYTFQKPMMIGASLAGVDDLTAIESLGKDIGIAFQMRDDLLDRMPNNEGKTKMSDIQEGNQTIVMSVCRESYDAEALKRLEDARGNPLSAEELSLLQEDFSNFAIQEKVSTAINALLDTVETEFHTLVLESDAKKNFLGVVGLLRTLGC